MTLQSAIDKNSGITVESGYHSCDCRMDLVRRSDHLTAARRSAMRIARYTRCRTSCHSSTLDRTTANTYITLIATAQILAHLDAQTHAFLRRTAIELATCATRRFDVNYVKINGGAILNVVLTYLISDCVARGLTVLLVGYLRDIRIN